MAMEVDKTDDGEGSVPRCCRAFGCYRVGAGVACLSGSLGLLGRLSLLVHMALHLTLFGESRKPTSPAVWGITNPYISCCGANPQFFVGGVHRFWTIQLRKLFTQSHSRQPFIVHSHIVSAALEINLAAGWCRSCSRSY